MPPEPISPSAPALEQAAHPAPCQPAAKADAGQRLAGSQQITFRHFVQGNRDAGSTGVAMTAYVFVKL